MPHIHEKIDFIADIFIAIGIKEPSLSYAKAALKELSQ